MVIKHLDELEVIIISNNSLDKLLAQLRKLASSSEEDFLRLLENDVFLDSFSLYFVGKIKSKHQGLISLIKLNLINQKTTSIVSILELVYQKVIELIELNSTENNTSILSKVELVNKKLIELAKLLIEREIDAQNEVNFVLRIEEQYLKLVNLVKSNLAESNRISVIFAIKVIYETIMKDIYRPLQGNSKSNFALTIETQYQMLIELMQLNLIDNNSKVFIPIIEKKCKQVVLENLRVPTSDPRIILLYKELGRSFSCFTRTG